MVCVLLLGIIFLFGLLWHSNRLDSATFSHRHVVLLNEVFGVNLVVVEHQFLIGFLLFGCIIDGVVPIEVDVYDSAKILI